MHDKYKGGNCQKQLSVVELNSIIKDLRRDNESLQVINNRYLSFLENAQDVFYQTSLDGTILYISPSIKNFAEFNNSEIQGSNVQDIYYNRNDRHSLLKLLQENGSVTDYEIKLKTKTGEIKYATINVQLIYNTNGEPDHFDGVIRDYTRRKLAEIALRESEERYRSVSETAQDVIVIINANGVITFWNKAAELVYGYSRQEILGNALNVITTNCCYEKFKHYLSEPFNRSSNTPKVEIIEGEGLSKYGTIFPIEFSVSAWESSSRTYFTFIIRDVTMRRKVQNELINAKEKAEESTRLKSAFLASISHEIRTPMNGILGFASLLKNSDLSIYDKKEYIRVLEESGIRLINLIDQLLEISKIESGIIELSSDKFDIDSLLNDIILTFKSKASLKGLKLEYSPSKLNNDTHILSDYEKVFHILSNLIDNAIKFSDNGVIRVGYEVEVNTSPLTTIDSNIRILASNYLVFFIEDSGIGIPKNRQHAIFDRFVKADISNKRAFQGVGLGLSIAREYARNLGGEIWVKSQESIGSTFYCKLPYIKQ